MKVAVLGAGVAGLVSAYRLSQRGHQCDVYERWPGLGGQAATLDVGGGQLLERYYHHLFRSDHHIQELCDELGLEDELEWRPSSMAIFAEGQLHAFTSPMDVLRFKPLSLRARLRMGAAVVLLQRRHPEVGPFEDVPAHEWIKRNMGREVYEKVWGPLLTAKFDGRAEDLSMAWLWSKLTIRRQIKGEQTRTELLGYPRNSFEPLFTRLRDAIEASGGNVWIDRPAARLARQDGAFLVTAGRPDSFRRGHDPAAFEPRPEEPVRYDAAIATVPNDVFEGLLDERLAAEVGDEYLGKLRSIEYHATMCLLLELDRRFSRFYWSNMADLELPFIGLIEQTNLIEPEHYGGRHFLYVANYKPHGDPLLALDPDELLDAYVPGLRKVNPEFSTDWVKQRWAFQEPAAQPVVTVGYQRVLPPLETPAAGLVLANTTQVYPQDRGTNYAVKLGTDAARTLDRQPVAG